MVDPMARRLRDETDRLAVMGPHSRAHALRILDLVPSLRLTSTRRSPDHNRRVGGSAGSYHLVGRAADYVGPRAHLERAASLARADRIGPTCTGPEEVLIHDVGTGLHLHIAW